MDPWREAMRRGDFAAAWRVCDEVLATRLASGPPPHSGPRHEQWIWDGRPVDGQRVLVRCYHGLGDTLQFVRFLPALRARARDVTLWAPPPLLGLLRSAPGADRVLPLHDGVPDVGYDVDLELMEVPHALRLESVYAEAVPYLRPRLARAGAGGAVPPRRPADATRVPRVGLTWRAGAWDPGRTLPDAALARLAGVRDVRWASLQFGVTPPAFAAEDLACADVERQAARMLDLDLVVTVDTVTAHLAGALGLQVWTLVPAPCDWRWAADDDRSRWYPTMRLFRQPAAGDWEGALRPACDALAAFVAAVRPGTQRRGEDFTERPRGAT